ncbi:phospholipase A and acyltransferase 4-like [Archocentrus centrarchus]|uniref:phospholipase A and acyltransferase 4-like n=1 Tax=Archocentrus centrarchus TaxID=63155 RepID=UPI0011E9BD93|nr:phospholipase A and acyltransferase 4-like [Archocentrus centrarchus]
MAPTLFDNDPKPGDLIEISRGMYTHWAVYIGGNEVVHLLPPTHPGGELGNFGELLTLIDSSTACVRRQKIWEVVGSSRFEVNNLLDDEYQPREPHVIVMDACRMVGRELPYSVATQNCEHFVTELRYGKPESRQVQTAAVIGGVAAVGVAVAVLGAALFSSLTKDENKRRNHK